MVSKSREMCKAWVSVNVIDTLSFLILHRVEVSGSFDLFDVGSHCLTARECGKSGRGYLTCLSSILGRISFDDFLHLASKSLKNHKNFAIYVIVFSIIVW